MRITTTNSDYLGAVAGVLCIIHCIVTPLLFVINAELATNQTLLVLQAIGYIFLIISFFVEAKVCVVSNVKIMSKYKFFIIKHHVYQHDLLYLLFHQLPSYQ